MDYLQYSYFNKKKEIEKWSFKPYYKWITFNTKSLIVSKVLFKTSVLNLIINGLPSIHIRILCIFGITPRVLNLIINGLPSILEWQFRFKCIGRRLSFKPYYKWITFNTEASNTNQLAIYDIGFKPYYKWITFNT